MSVMLGPLQLRSDNPSAGVKILDLVRSELYMTFILFTHEKIPAKDKTHDMKHIISAAYCNKFLSADKPQLKIIKQINPDLEVLGWDDFTNQIQPGAI
jgi:hypothetical protein